jgi:glutaredoxin
MSPVARIPRLAAAVLALATLSAAGAAGAQTTYRWKDAQGRVHYSDQPPPPEVRELDEQRYAAPAAAQVPSYTLRKLAADFPVTLYSADNCGDLCVQARALLNKRGVPFAERKLATAEDHAAFQRDFNAPPEVPTLAVGRNHLRGLEAGGWNRLLDDAGYPKTPLPPR